jgi:hypothetical protein
MPTPGKKNLPDPDVAFPGYKRNLKLVVASTAPPVIQPRQTRASTLRTGKDAAASTSRLRPSTSSGTSMGGPTTGTRTKSGQAQLKATTEGTFVGVPGHKRSESIPVASTRPPSAPPRLNRSATLRARKMSQETQNVAQIAAALSNTHAGTPSLPPTDTQQPAYSRPHSRVSAAAIAPATIAHRPTIRTANAAPPSSYRGPQTGSSSDDDRDSTTLGARSESRRGRSESRASASGISTSRPPSIEPRTNRAALLRALAGTPTGEPKLAPKAVWV